MSLKAVEEVSAQVPAEDFEALEEKVYRTIELYKAAKEARTAAERDVKRIREQLEEREEENEAMRRDASQSRPQCRRRAPSRTSASTAMPLSR